ncbi:hypothetical protein HCN44_011031 [Aphidius gifuensis]|uniref:Tesmin/TSO1-like CXC domain-containing protein n=1 Tax=Aphidius gifuensis TaxID=684658 RepID=A0A834Y3F6_APHGI|nr:hypothetical protein HCN44_011031 [Aphidius gifuensis]
MAEQKSSKRKADITITNNNNKKITPQRKHDPLSIEYQYKQLMKDYGPEITAARQFNAQLKNNTQSISNPITRLPLIQQATQSTSQSTNTESLSSNTDYTKWIKPRKTTKIKNNQPSVHSSTESINKYSDIEDEQETNSYHSTKKKKNLKVNKKPLSQTRIAWLINKSKLANDLKWTVWENDEVLYAHDYCLLSYSRYESKKSTENLEPSVPCSSDSQSPTNEFDFDINCFFCGEMWDCNNGAIIDRQSMNGRIIDIVQSLSDESYLKNPLGVCSTYYQLRLYEASVLLDPPQMKIDGTSLQYVFDNTDHNVITIDGETKRLTQMPSKDNISAVNTIQDVHLPIDFQGGLNKLKFEDLDTLNLNTSPYLPVSYSTYILAKHLKINKIPLWHGFEELLYSDEILHPTSRIVCLPFIYHKATDYLAIHTALCYAVEHAKKNGQIFVFVTFDQPLYKIARDILTGLENDSMQHVFIRLGGFHIILSALGAVAYPMTDSGIAELFSVVYAPQTVKHLLDGKAYARAMRAHILAYTALGKLICDKFPNDKKQEYKDYLNVLFQGFSATDSYEGPYEGDVKVDKKLLQINQEFIEILNILKKNGPTAQLWIQYFESVTILLQYIEAERSGNWNLHLQSVRKMLPSFHAAKHFNYAKFAHLYLQDMAKLESVMTTDEFNKFTRDSFFTIRRTDKSFNGVWSDMTIEQTLNRFFGTDLVHGRGVTESVVSRYLGAMPTMFMVMDCLEDFCKVKTHNSEQQIDLSRARLKLDEADTDKFYFWLNEHDPFMPRSSVVSLSTGVMGGPRINCHKAIEIGEKNIRCIVGKNAKTFSFSSLDKITTLASAKQNAHLAGKYEAINALNLFNEISGSLKNDDDLKKALNYELAPYPLSLFDNKGFIRKSEQTLLRAIGKTIETDKNFVDNLEIVLDGNFLLKAISSWPQSEKFSDICQLYLDYIAKTYPVQFEMKCIYIVFRLYNDKICGIKSYELFRRNEKGFGPDFNLQFNSICSVTKIQFLSNIVNKQKFVLMLFEYLKNHINVVMSQGDGDSDIINTALNLASRNHQKPVAVLSDNIDLLILLITLSTQNDQHLYYCQIDAVGKPLKTCPVSEYGDLKPFLLFAHVFSGCKTTSSIYKKGKITILNMIKKNMDMQTAAKVFYNQSSSASDVAIATEKIFLCLYQSKGAQQSLETLRYNSYVSLASNLTVEQRLASLPPTLFTAHQHGKRVFYQMQRWLGNNNLRPEEWGWKRHDMMLVPIMTMDFPAPKELCDKIFCGCTRKCQSKLCKCRKVGLSCSKKCTHCHGTSCDNSSNSLTIYSRKENEENDENDDDEREELLLEHEQENDNYNTNDNSRYLYRNQQARNYDYDQDFFEINFSDF